jgi:hypothetical protein
MHIDLALVAAFTVLCSSITVWGLDLRDMKVGRVMELLAFVTFDHDFKLPFFPVKRCEKHQVASCISCFGRKRGG